MSNVPIALIFAVAVSIWGGRWFYKRTGGNSQKSYTAGAVIGGLVFLIMLTLLSKFA